MTLTRNELIRLNKQRAYIRAYRQRKRQEQKRARLAAVLNTMNARREPTMTKETR